jgi:hypothetical protein
MEARGTLGLQMQNPAHLPKFRDCFKTAINVTSLCQKKLKRPDTHLTKILRSFGCCPLRNLGNFSEGQRLKRAPVGGALKASLRGPS